MARPGPITEGLVLFAEGNANAWSVDAKGKVATPCGSFCEIPRR